MNRGAALALAAAAAGLLTVSAVAEACSFCGAARKDASVAYVVTAAAMGLMPIVFGTALVFWLRGKYRRAGKDEEPCGPPRS